MTLKKVKNIMPSLKALVPHMLQSNVVYKITCPGCNSSYVGQTTRQLQRRFRDHTGNRGSVKSHLDDCGITPNSNIIQIIGKANTPYRLLTLEALFIKEFKPSLNTKDEFKSRTLTLKFWSAGISCSFLECCPLLIEYVLTGCYSFVYQQFVGFMFLW